MANRRGSKSPRPLLNNAIPTLDTIATKTAALKAELARRDLLSFTLYTNPDYEVNWHHRIVAEALDRVLAGKCRRLMIFGLPQNGKALAVELILILSGWRCLGDS